MSRRGTAGSVTSQVTAVTSAPAGAQAGGGAFEFGGITGADDQRAAVPGQFAGERRPEPPRDAPVTTATSPPMSSRPRLAARAAAAASDGS